MKGLAASITVCSINNRLRRSEIIMRRFVVIAASAVLMTSSIGVAYAAPSSMNGSAREAKEVRATLALMDQQIASVSDEAFKMNHAVYRDYDDPEFQSDELTQVGETVNKVGRELAAIEAERASIPQWEAAAVDQVLPIMHNVAAESTQAIRTFDAGQDALFANGYAAETNDISSDALKAAQLLHHDIELGQTQAKEARLTASLGQNATSAK
jgi:hypothetical protein